MKENHNCNKCGKETSWEDSVWCNTCGVTYCKECTVVGLPTSFDLPVDVTDNEEGDVGIIADLCANCYADYCDEYSETKYTLEDIDKI